MGPSSKIWHFFAINAAKGSASWLQHSVNSWLVRPPVNLHLVVSLGETFLPGRLASFSPPHVSVASNTQGATLDSLCVLVSSTSTISVRSKKHTVLQIHAYTRKLRWLMLAVRHRIQRIGFLFLADEPTEWNKLVSCSLSQADGRIGSELVLKYDEVTRRGTRLERNKWCAQLEFGTIYAIKQRSVRWVANTIPAYNHNRHSERGNQPKRSLVDWSQQGSSPSGSPSPRQSTSHQLWNNLGRSLPDLQETLKWNRCPRLSLE